MSVSCGRFIDALWCSEHKADLGMAARQRMAQALRPELQPDAGLHPLSLTRSECRMEHVT